MLKYSLIFTQKAGVLILFLKILKIVLPLKLTEINKYAPFSSINPTVVVHLFNVLVFVVVNNCPCQ